MANHSTINNLRMLNPHKFATYQFVKQYFSVSPYMFMNFTNPTDATDYSYNDIIHMLDPFLNEFKHRDKATEIGSENEVNLPNAVSQYNNNLARNSFDIIDHFGYYNGTTTTGNPCMANVDFHGSIFAAFIPVYALDRTKIHTHIGKNLGNPFTGDGHGYTDQVYDYTFYSTGGYSSYLVDGGRQLNTNPAVYIDTAVPFKRTAQYSGGGMDHHSFLYRNFGYSFHRAENVNESLRDDESVSIGKTLILTKNTTNSVFKAIDNLMNGNLRNNIQEIEKTLINATKNN